MDHAVFGANESLYDVVLHVRVRHLSTSCLKQLIDEAVAFICDKSWNLVDRNAVSLYPLTWLEGSIRSYQRQIYECFQNFQDANPENNSFYAK